MRATIALRGRVTSMPNAISPGCPAFIISFNPRDLERPVRRAYTKESLPMSRLKIPSREQSPVASKPLLEVVEKQLGVVPNLFRLLGLSPAALEAYVSSNSALGKTLDVKTRERIALAIAQFNSCDYCLSAHTYLGLNLAKLDDAEVRRNRQGHSDDVKADAAVVFARRVAESRGRVSDAELAAVKAAGYSEAHVIEIVANVAINVLTNFVNNVACTDIDFPAVHAEVA